MQKSDDVKVVVTEAAVRDLINEALDGKAYRASVRESADNMLDGPPVSMNPVVDQSAFVTDPDNENFVPLSKQEFMVTLSSLLNDVPNQSYPEIFKQLKGAVEDAKLPQKDNKMDKNKKKVEEAIRRSIRGILAEINPKFDFSYSGDVGGESDDDDDDLKPAKKSGKSSYKSTSVGKVDQFGGASLEQIAAELGMSTSGAKQAVDKAMLKLRFHTEEFPPGMLEKITLMIMSEYIDWLKSSGELTDEDVELLKAHPDIVRQLDSFQEFAEKNLKMVRDHYGYEPEPLRNETE